MLKAVRNVSGTSVAYVCLLLSFAALGMFVYALAAGSAVAGVIGAALIVLMAAAVVGFYIGARTRAASNDSGIDIPSENIWARPLRREQISRYMQNYRAVRDSHEQVLQAVAVPLGTPANLEDRQAA